MNTYLKFPLIFLALCLIFLSCDKKRDNNQNRTIAETDISTSYAYEKIDSLFLEELTSRKIIMINDANHGQGYFMLRVTAFLNHWLNSISPDPTTDKLPRKLVLFLECNKDAEMAINKYIKTGDLYSFLKTNIEFDLEAHSNIFTIDYMIFINELRRISKRIKHINEQIKYSKIEFKICGAESDPPFYKKIFELDRQQLRKEKELWFAKRDKKCSENIHSYLKDYPDYRAIVFYGATHLFRNRANKSFDKDELDPEIYDYYLSYYLDSIFGRDNVSIFWYVSNPWVELEKVDKIGLKKETPDYIIYSKPVPSAPVPYSFAKTKTYLNALYEILNKYVDSEVIHEMHIAKVAAFKLNNAILRADPVNAQKINRQFKVLARSKNKKVEAKRFINFANVFLNEYSVLDGLKYIPESISYSDYPDSMIYNRELYLLLTNISQTQIDWPRQSLNPAGFRKQFLSKSKNINDSMAEISRYIAIHQLFIATEDEKKSILEYLNNELKFKGYSDDIWLNWLYQTINP